MEEENDEEDDEDEEEEDRASQEPRRKKMKKQGIDDIDEREDRLRRRENDHLRRKFSVRETDDSETSVSTSEDAVYGEDVEPEFDLMKSMLRAGYGGPKSELKSKAKEAEEEKNMEVEDVRKEKAVSGLMRGGGGGGGRSSSEVVEERESKGLGRGGVEGKGKEGIKFKDLGGIKSVLEELKMEVIVPLYHPQLPQWLGVKPMAGILLHGPPGCGKTRLAHAIANETGVPFYQISATEIVSGVSGIVCCLFY